MSYAVGDIRRWDVSALIDVGHEVELRRVVAEDARRSLSDGAAMLDEGWDGLSAVAVLDAAEGERLHVSHLADGVEDLADVLGRTQAALGSAVQAVKDRIADAEAAGFIVTDVAVEPAAGGVGAGASPDQAIVDLHAEAISSAIVTVRSLDEHYGREIDSIAARLHAAIPPEVDRSPIPGPDDPWPGRGVDAMTGAMGQGNPALAHELDPETRGKHKLNPVPDAFGRDAAKGLRVMGKAAGPLGAGLTVYDGVKAHAEGETSAGEAAFETGGALGGGMLGGMAAGAAVGSLFGPAGTFLGAGVGAVVGTELGKGLGSWTHETIFGD